MKTLIIDNFDSFTYNLSQYCAELGGHPEVYRNDAITLEEIRQKKYTHIILSPGPGSPETPRDFGICEAIIKSLAPYIPILGVCLGHQGIIYEFGGHVIRAPIPMHGKMSRVNIDTTHPLFVGLPSSIDAMRYHSLLGERKSLPRELHIIAETEDEGLIMGVSHHSFPLYGVQFHPESIGTPQGKEILRNFLTIQPPGDYSPVSSQDLSIEEAEQFLDAALAGTLTDEEIGAELTRLAEKGESVSEIIGMVQSLRKHALPFPTNETTLMDTCGTGGSGLPRMNISTVAAFVLATGGIKIAKHGNRAASGRVGSFDLLEALGINILLESEHIQLGIEQLGLGFLFAPRFHPTLKRLATLRKQLGRRTILNLLGPLVNPVQPRFHLLGTSSVSSAERLAHAMLSLSYEHAMVVTGEDGLDDVTLLGDTYCYEIFQGTIRSFTFSPEEVGFPRRTDFSDIAGGSLEDNLSLFHQLLLGTAPIPLQQLLLINCAFGFFVRGVVSDLSRGVALAQSLINSGKAYEKFQQYLTFSQFYVTSPSIS